MKQIMENKMLDTDEKMKLYNNVLQKFMLTKTQAMRERVVPVKWSETNVRGESDQPCRWGYEIDRDDVEIVAQEIVRSLLHKFRNKGAALMDRINKSNALNCNRRGELVYKGQTIPGSHISDLVNDAIRRRKNFNPTGVASVCQSVTRTDFSQRLDRPQTASRLYGIAGRRRG